MRLPSARKTTELFLTMMLPKSRKPRKVSPLRNKCLRARLNGLLEVQNVVINPLPHNTPSLFKPFDSLSFSISLSRASL